MEPDHCDKSVAFERLIGSLEEAMYCAVWRVARQAHAAEDALQNVLLKIWQKIEQIGRHPHPKALVLKICVDEAWSVRRGMKRNAACESITLESLSSPQKTPMQILAEKESLVRLLDAIRDLPEQQAICLWLRCVEQLSYDQIAIVAECSEATVRKHVERARERLSHAFDPARLNRS